MIHMQDPRFLHEFFVNHNLKRFGGEFHARPIWYLLPVLLIAGMPWSFLTCSLTRFLFSRSHEIRENRPPAFGFLALAAGWAFLFFSLSKCKLATYLLPAAPCLALMVGHYLHVVLDRADRTTFRFCAVRGCEGSYRRHVRCGDWFFDLCQYLATSDIDGNLPVVVCMGGDSGLDVDPAK